MRVQRIGELRARLGIAAEDFLVTVFSCYEAIEACADKTEVLISDFFVTRLWRNYRDVIRIS
jgi:hypothetical protein